MKMPSITLDAGHGGKDPGAVGLRGLREKDVALAVTTRMALMLQAAGVSVKQTRLDDRFLELHERAAIANAAGTDLFLSIHCNSAESRAASGFEVFTTPGKTMSDAFATCLFEEYARRFPTKLKRMDTADGDPDKEANFAVIRLAKMPAALFELDFISHPTAENWLWQEIHQIAMAEALSDGVLKYLGLTKAAAPAPPEIGTPERLDGETLLERLVPVLEEARELSRNVAGRMEELSDAELRGLLGALARHDDAHGTAGELLGLALVEASARFLSGNNHDENAEA